MEDKDGITKGTEEVGGIEGLPHAGGLCEHPVEETTEGTENPSMPEGPCLQPVDYDTDDGGYPTTVNEVLTQLALQELPEPPTNEETELIPEIPDEIAARERHIMKIKIARFIGRASRQPEGVIQKEIDSLTYSLIEMGLLPETINPDHVILCWRLCEALRINRLPTGLRM